MGILGWLHGSLESDDDVRIVDAMEAAVRGTDPRIRLVKGYRRRLRPAVERALEYCRELVEAIPGPFNASIEGWSTDPTVRALFTSAEELRGILSRSLEVSEFVASPANAEVHSVFGILSMVRTEHVVLGAALQGEFVRVDVPQRTVSFSHHAVRAPRGSEANLRRELEWRAFEHLVLEALEHVTFLQERRTRLVCERRLLRSRLSLMTGARAGLDGLHVLPEEDTTTFRRLRDELVENERELEAMQESLGNLEDYLERVVEVLGDPGSVVRIERASTRLTALNVVAENDRDAAVDLMLAEFSVHAPTPAKRTVAIIRFPRAELIPRRLALDEAAKLLGSV